MKLFILGTGAAGGTLARLRRGEVPAGKDGDLQCEVRSCCVFPSPVGLGRCALRFSVT